MIISTITSGTQMALRRWTCSTDARVIVINEAPFDSGGCLCDYQCDYYEYAFTNSDNPSDSYTNDYRKFLVTPQSDNATVEFYIVDSSGNETLFDSNYGDIYTKGFNERQPLQEGILVKWYLVADFLGYGNYTIKTVLTEFGNTVEQETHNFKVVPFDTVRASDTVKIEVVYSGYTMNGKDYTGLGDFVNMARVKGNFIETDPDIEKESVVTTSRKVINTQTKKTNTYQLNIEDLPSSIGDGLIDEGAVMAWIVTDYDFLNDKSYQNIECEVDTVSITKIPYYTRRYFEVSLKALSFKLNRKFV